MLRLFVHVLFIYSERVVNAFSNNNGIIRQLFNPWRRR